MNVERTRARLVAGLGSFALLFTLMLGVHALQTVPAGTIAAHWPLDSATTTTPDVSANANTATLVNTPATAIVPGLFGNGMQFASASKRSLTAPDKASLGIGTTNSFTVAAWIKPTGTGLMRIMNKWNGSIGFHFDINAAVGGGNTVGHLRLRARDGTRDHDYAVAGALGTGNWKHIAAVYDRPTKETRLYVDGRPVGSKVHAAVLSTTLTNLTPLEIGALTNAGHFNGIMDEPIFYMNALTPAQVKVLAAVPQGLTATTTLINRVTLTWTAVPGAATYNILRSATAGGPYTALATVASPATTYTDLTATTPGSYYYIIRAHLTGAGGYTSTDSNEAHGISLPPQVTALPNIGLQTNENGASTGFTVKFNQAAPAGGSLVVVSCSDTSEAVISTTYPGTTPTATGFQVLVPAGQSPTIPVTVTGLDDFFADPAQAYTVTVTASGFAGLVIPAVQCTNNDNDTAGVTISRTSGLVTTEAGGQDSFAVTLNTQPLGSITMALSSSRGTEGTVSPTSITFTPANWNTAQPVTVTGVDDADLDFAVPYSIVTGTLVTMNTGDVPAYGGMNPQDVQVSNIDNETIPPLDGVWGGGDSGGGCGLTGLEAGLALVLAALLRRRRQG